MPRSRKIIIFGAGPIGLESALHARKLGHDVTLYERGDVADSVRKWGHISMFTPFGDCTTARGRKTVTDNGLSLPSDNDIVTGNQFIDSYLSPLAESSILDEVVQLKHSVLAVGNAEEGGFRVLVRNADGTETSEFADTVFDCTGTFRNPRFVGEGGIPAVGELHALKAITFGPIDLQSQQRDTFANKTIIVIGSGHTAATTIRDLTQLAESEQSTWIIWLTHGSRSSPIVRLPNDPYKERDRLTAKVNHLAARCEGNLEYHAHAIIEELAHHDGGFRVTARISGEPQTFEAEQCVVNVGYRSDNALSQMLMDSTGYHVLGAKSSNGLFLLKEGHRQIEEMLAIK